MDIALIILAALGALLFIVGYLGFVIAGFKHHFVTGLISAFPVLNIVTVPALWRNAGRKVIMSTIGLVIVTASWFFGADTSIKNTIAKLKGESSSLTAPVLSSTQDSSSAIIPETTTTISQATPDTAKPYANQQRKVDESNMLALPKKALYRMSFEPVPISNVQTLKDRVVQIITNNNEQLEGRINNVTASSISILGNELPIANIKKISLMVKKAQ